jgi:PAS domain S-box-containing protein
MLQDMFLRPASSLTHRTLRLIALAVSVLLAITTFVTYRLILGGIEERGRIHLEQYVAERAQREQERFIQLRENLELVSRTFREALRQAPDLDYRARWDALVVRDPDGAWRSPRGKVDGTRDCTFWAHRDVVLTPELLRRTIVLHNVLETFRPVWIGSFRSLWGSTPEMTNIGFDPLIPDWIYHTPADWAQNEAAYYKKSGPVQNPARKLTWTFQAQNLQDGYFYTVCLPVYEADRLIATIGHDIHIPRLFEESLKTNIAGMTHLMFEADGRLVAHPAKKDQIFSSAGEFSMKDDPALRSLHSAVIGQAGGAVSGYDPATGQYFAARRLQDPAWYFMATLPRALLEQQAFQHAHWVLWIGLGSLALVLAWLALILRYTLTLPLRRLIGATERIAAGDPGESLPVPDDNEIGRLSGAFNRMARNVAERDLQLRHLNQDLEHRISERTAELAASESRIRAILENAPEAIVVIDADSGRFVDGNENALRLLGLDRATLLQRSPMDARATHQPDGQSSARVARARIDAAMAGETQVFEWLYRPAAGADVLCEVRLSRLPSGASRLVIGIITDISERKQVENTLMQALARERELGEMKSGFVSMVSHEFRTPLGVILSSTEILQHYFDRLGPDKRNEHLRTIVRSVRSLSRLVEEVLLLGKVEAGRLKFLPDFIDLPPLCQQLADEARSAAPGEQTIAVDLGPDLSDAVGDENLIRHILTNLLSNAVKYSPSGQTIRFVVERTGEYAIFTIIDRGIGIPADDMRNLYKAFHRGRNVGQQPGTGLGLVVVRSFVQHHGGEIDIASEVGVGTTVTVRLPLFGRFAPTARNRFLNLDPQPPVADSTE